VPVDEMMDKEEPPYGYFDGTWRDQAGQSIGVDVLFWAYAPLGPITVRSTGIIVERERVRGDL
jgi:hypothetical protein